MQRLYKIKLIDEINLAAGFYCPAHEPLDMPEAAATDSCCATVQCNPPYQTIEIIELPPVVQQHQRVLSQCLTRSSMKRYHQHEYIPETPLSGEAKIEASSCHKCLI